MVGFNSYLLASTGLAAGIVINAIKNHKDFYPTVVYLGTSKVAILSLVNFVIVLGFWVYKGLLALFFQRLRSTEMQHIES